MTVDDKKLQMTFLIGSFVKSMDQFQTDEKLAIIFTVLETVMIDKFGNSKDFIELLSSNKTVIELFKRCLEDAYDAGVKKFIGVDK